MSLMTKLRNSAKPETSQVGPIYAECAQYAEWEAGGNSADTAHIAHKDGIEKAHDHDPVEASPDQADTPSQGQGAEVAMPRNRESSAPPSPEQLAFDEAHNEANDARTRPAWSELPTEPCPWCGRTLFWQNLGRSWRCAWCAEPAEPWRWTFYRLPRGAA